MKKTNQITTTNITNNTNNTNTTTPKEHPYPRVLRKA